MYAFQCAALKHAEQYLASGASVVRPQHLESPGEPRAPETLAQKEGRRTDRPERGRKIHAPESRLGKCPNADLLEVLWERCTSKTLTVLERVFGYFPQRRRKYYACQPAPCKQESFFFPCARNLSFSQRFESFVQLHSFQLLAVLKRMSAHGPDAGRKLNTLKATLVEAPYSYVFKSFGKLKLSQAFAPIERSILYSLQRGGE